MAAWQLAPALGRLREQVNAFAPKRSKLDDGTIGDAAHRSRKSDHNPNKYGDVTAVDLTHDPAGGLDSYKLAETLRMNRDSRLEFAISAGKIFFSSGNKPWQWQPYTGKNAHRQHVHVSVIDSRLLYNDKRDWNISVGPIVSLPAESTPPTLWLGAKGEDVIRLQTLLNDRRSRPITVDGKFGKETQAAVRAFQKEKELVVDGVAGANTWLALLT